MLNALIFFATVIAPSISGVLITIAYLPQVIKNYRTKSVEDLSLGFWWLITSFLVCMVANAAHLLVTANAVGYFVTEVINFAFAVVIVVQIYVYRRKGRK